MSTQSRRSSTTARRRRFIAPLPAVLVALVGTLMIAPAAASAAPAEAAVPGSAGVDAAVTTTVDASIDATVTSSGTSAASAGKTAGGQKAPAAADDETPSLSLSLPDFGVVGDELTATVTLTNPSDGNPLTAAVGDPLPAGRIVLERADRPLSSRSALGSWLDGSSHPTMREIASAPTEELAVGSSADIELTAKVDGDDGVYPITARFEPTVPGDAPRLSDSTVLTRNDGPTPDVTLVVPITAPASSRGLLTAEQLETLTAPDGALRRALDGVSGTDAILAVDPAIPAAVRVLGSAAPASAITWLDDLMKLPNDRFALQFGDADPTTQLADDGELLEPTSLAPYIAGAGDVDETGSGTPSDEPEPTPTPEVDPVDMTMEELLDIGRATPDVYWPDPAVAGADTVSAIAELGGTSLMSSDSTKAGDKGKTVAARAAGALVYDADASESLTRAASITDRAEREESLAGAVADLWLASEKAKGADLLVALDRTGGIRVAEAQEDTDAKPTSRTAEALADTADAVGAFDSAPLRSLLSAKAGKVSFGADADPFRAGTAAELAAHDEALTELGSVLSDAELLTGRTRAEQLQLLAVSWSPFHELWRDAYDAHIASLDSLQNAVGLVPPSDVNLLSSQAPLPVWVRNDLPYPVTVTLYSYPDDVRLSMDTSTEVEAPASSNTRVQLPVRATLGSGNVAIRLRVESPTGVEIGDTQVMRVTVRADWERYGVAGLVALIVLLVAAGTIRTLLRRRTRKRAAAVGAEEGAAVEPEDGETPDDGHGAAADAADGAAPDVTDADDAHGMAPDDGRDRIADDVTSTVPDRTTPDDDTAPDEGSDPTPDDATGATLNGLAQDDGHDPDPADTRRHAAATHDAARGDDAGAVPADAPDEEDTDGKSR